MTKRRNQTSLKNKIVQMYEGIKGSYIFVSILGSAILAFGLYNVHSISNVTEGGVLGLILLLEYWLKISPALSGFVLNLACYITGWKILGRKFIVYSFISSVGFSTFYWVFEQFGHVFPEIANMPFVAAIVGALFVGIGAGLCVRIGGAPSGDDAIAMGFSKAFHVDIQWVYLISDLIVLILSLSYIPVTKIMYSLLTVILSGQIIGLVQKIKLPKINKKNQNAEA